MDLTLLQQQRAALEALATTLEAMEEDFKVGVSEFTAGAASTNKLMAVLAPHEQPPSPSLSESQCFKVMLASSSKWRQAIILQILPEGFALSPLQAISPDIDEKSIRRTVPEDLVLAIADAKADAVLRKLATAVEEVDFVICADQVIVFDDQIREKPESESECKSHLQSYGNEGIPARCVTGVVVVDVVTRERFSGTEEALQFFKPVPDHIVDALIVKGDVLSCAGSFVVEDALLAPFLEKRVGDVECVQGMPKKITRKLLVEVSKQRRQQFPPQKRLKSTPV